MVQRLGVVVFSAAMAIGVMAALPSRGEAAGSGAQYTLSLTKEYTASPWTNEMGYANRLKGKLVFGAKNLLLGWTELFTEPMEANQQGGNVLTGIGMGLKNTLFDTLGGVVHLVTFPVTSLDAPLPQGGVFQQ